MLADFKQRLARILGRIVRDLYSIKPISTSRRALVTERISRDLSDWRVELAPFLDSAPSPNFFQLLPILQRQRNVLNLTYWHAIILTYRPYVLSNMSRLTRRELAGAETVVDSDPQTDEGVKQCLAAAMSTVRTVEEISSGSQFFRAFWVFQPATCSKGYLLISLQITAYFAFTATIVLYLYVIQKRALPPDAYSQYFVAATRCQSHLLAIAEEGSLLQRYVLVLEELRVEALRQVKRMNPNWMSTYAAPSNTLQAQAHIQQDTGSLGMNPGLMGGQSIDEALAMMEMFNESPSAATNYTDLLVEGQGDMTNAGFGGLDVDLSGWDQFANMVSAGLGNLDGFIRHAQTTPTNPMQEAHQ